MADTLLVATNSKMISERMINEFRHTYRVDVKNNVGDVIIHLSKHPEFALIDISIPESKDKNIVDLLISLKLSRINNYILLNEMSDLKIIENLPHSENTKHFLVGKKSKKDWNTLIDTIKKHLDPENYRKMKLVKYVAEDDLFYIIFWNDKEYRLNRSDLSEIDDRSGISDVVLDNSGGFFKVVQKSEEEYEVPWDFVLYHCEPEYEYYKGKQDEKKNANRNRRIGERIKMMRRAKGLTSYQLADITGIKRPNIARLESGKHSASVDTLERIADAFKVPVSSLL